MTMTISGSTGLEFPDGSDQTSAFTGNAASITSGTLNVARLPTTGVNAASITTGTLAVANGGTGTASPSLVGGTNITISGSWPNQTVTAAGGAPTTAQVLSATAGLTAGDVGTYVVAVTTIQSGIIGFGGTRAGSQLRPSGWYFSGDIPYWNPESNGTLSGTWRCLGADGSGNIGANRSGALWIRIS
jgi:hypothetical protein